MPKKIPVPDDFPPHVTVVITYPGSADSTPPPTTSTAGPSNILILLHGLGDTAAAFTSFGRALNLPETICVTVQAPSPLPAGFVEQEGYHWGNDVIFEDDGLAMDAGGFDRSAARYLARDVVTETLVQKCGYRLRDIMLLGLGQGGMAALVAARELGSHPPPVPDSAVMVSTSSSPIISSGSDSDASLAGVVSLGASYPLSASTVGPKNRTPVLLLAGRDDGHTAVSDTAVRRTKDVFEFVEIHRWPRRGDGMPRNRDDVLPLMQFFARRLRSRQGVPEGSIELT
jgi:predicted esterase